VIINNLNLFAWVPAPAFAGVTNTKTFAGMTRREAEETDKSINNRRRRKKRQTERKRESKLLPSSP
jgi:hypothetical protein